MKVTDLVANKINRLKTGYVFTYDEFGLLQPPEYQIVKDLLEEKNVKVVHNSEYLIVFVRNSNDFRIFKK